MNNLKFYLEYIFTGEIKDIEALKRIIATKYMNVDCFGYTGVNVSYKVTLPFGITVEATNVHNANMKTAYISSPSVFERATQHADTLFNVLREAYQRKIVCIKSGH